MANFDPPIASVGGVARPPTVLEKANGLQCGPADLKLFNFLFQRIQAELKSIQDAGGIVGDDADDTTVLQAILELISSATGGGDPENYVQFPQAQTRLLFFPEVTTDNGVVPVVDAGGGVIRVPAGKVLLHRGIRPYTLPLTDFPTVANKTYHLRWNQTDGLSLKDVLPGGAYNPGSLAEGNVAFDSTYDDVLLARIMTNASNVPAITNLINKHQYSLSGVTAQAIDTPYQDNTLPSAISNGRTIDFNLARKPRVAISAIDDLDTTRSGQTEVNFGIRANSRYNGLVWYQNNSTAQTEAASIAYEVWL